LLRFRVTLVNTSAAVKSLPLTSSHHYSWANAQRSPPSSPLNIFVSGEAFRQVVRKDESTFNIRPADWITKTSTVDHGWDNQAYVSINPGEVVSYDTVAFYTYGWENVSLKSKVHQNTLIQYTSRPQSLTFIRDHKYIAKQFVIDSTTRRNDEETSPRAFTPGRKFRLCVTADGSISNFVSFKVDHSRHTPTSPATPLSRAASRKPTTSPSLKGLQPTVLFPADKK
jgi:hypothetical protein